MTSLLIHRPSARYALPQFIKNIDGVDIHFIHVRLKNRNALPIIITHGWPGSIIEQHRRIDILVNNAGVSISLPFVQIELTDLKKLMGFSNCVSTELAGTTVKVCLVIPPPRKGGNRYCITAFSDFCASPDRQKQKGGLTLYKQYITFNNMKSNFIYPAILFSLLSCNSSIGNHQTPSQDSIADTTKGSSKKIEKFFSSEVVTQQMIDTTKDENLDELIFSNIYSNTPVSEETTIDQYHKVFEKLSEGQKAFYSTRNLEKNVLDGGFNQYFKYYLSNGQFAEDAHKGYQVLKMDPLAELVQQAASIYHRHPLDSIAQFNKLDTTLKQLVLKYDPSAVRIRYIRANPREFTQAR